MFVCRIQLLWKSSLQRRYPPSQLCRLPSQPLRHLPSSPSVAGSYSIARRSRSIKSWSGCLAYPPSLCVARCRLRPREWRLSLVLQKSGRRPEPAMPGRFSPFGRVSPSSSPSAHPFSCRYCPCCLCQKPLLRPLQLHFRGYVPDSASIASPRNLSSSRNTRCWIWIRAVDYPYPEGFAPS